MYQHYIYTIYGANLLCLFVLSSGDGDSSVCKRLNEVMPYGPTFLVEKIECRNHILRNYGQKIMNLTRNTEYPGFIQKFITKNLLRFRTAITKAIKYRNQIDESHYNKIEGKHY